MDPEALSLSMKRGFMFGYNVQAAVDETSQIVVANDLQDCATDYSALPRLVDQVKENCGAHAASYLADAGYQSVDNIKKIKKVGSAPIVSRKTSKMESEDDEEFSEQVIKGDEDREYFCKAGRRLPLASRCSTGYLVFRLSKRFCRGCDVQSSCCAYGKKTPEVLDDADRALINEFLSTLPYE